MRVTSTSALGRASRRFIIGTRLCPPARLFAPSPRPPREDLRLAPNPRQQRDRLFHAVGAVIGERGWLHRDPSRALAGLPGTRRAPAAAVRQRRPPPVPAG